MSSLLSMHAVIKCSKNFEHFLYIARLNEFKYSVNSFLDGTDEVDKLTKINEKPGKHHEYHKNS